MQYSAPFFDPFGAYDPFNVPLYLPGTQPQQRRRVGPSTIEVVPTGARGPTEPGMTPSENIQGREPFVVGSSGFTRSIPVDFIERENEYVIRSDIPGVKKEELHLSVHHGKVLRFGAVPHSEREKEDEEETGVFHRAERVSSFRNRNLRMPDDANMEGDIKATYTDGVLEVIIPKKKTEGEEGAKRTIPIAGVEQPQAGAAQVDMEPAP